MKTYWRGRSRYFYSRKEFSSYLIAGVAFLFLYLVEQITAVRLGYYLNFLNRQLGQLQVDNYNYRQEYSQLVSLKSLNDFARQKKMTAPKVTEIIYLNDEEK